MKRFCPICLSREKKILYKQNFDNKVISLMEKYDVVVCHKCGFVYADNIPSQEEFNRYYATMSKYEFDYKNGLVSNDYTKHFKKIFNFLTPYLKDKNASILDIGCSTGCLLSLFKQNGYLNLLGVDPSVSCAMTVKKLYKIEAKNSNLSSFKTNEKFDLIILSAVLEHLVDLKTSLQKIQFLLKEHGLLFIEVPDATRFASYIFTPFQQFSIEHVNYFSEFSIRNLLLKFSFKIIKTRKDKNEINESADPDIFILSKKSDFTRQNNLKITRDNIGESKIKKYISLCFKIDLKLKKIIQKKLLKKNKIIVWGVGTHTQRLIGSGWDLSKILYFVDSNTRYHGKKIKGKEIKSPNEIKEDLPILISTYSYQKEVVRQIRKELKLKNEIIKLY